MNPNPSVNSALVRSADGEPLDLPWGRIVWTVSRQLGNSTQLTFGRVTIKAGHENNLHRHPNCDEVLHVVSGRIEHAIGERLWVMEPGDSISIPAGAWHNARALGDEDADLVICFSSADRETESREDAE